MNDEKYLSITNGCIKDNAMKRIPQDIRKTRFLDKWIGHLGQ